MTSSFNNVDSSRIQGCITHSCRQSVHCGPHQSILWRSRELRAISLKFGAMSHYVWHELRISGPYHPMIWTTPDFRTVSPYDMNNSGFQDRITLWYEQLRNSGPYHPMIWTTPDFRTVSPYDMNNSGILGNITLWYEQLRNSGQYHPMIWITHEFSAHHSMPWTAREFRDTLL